MPSVLRYPQTATADADWSNPNNIKVEDGSYATSSNWTVKGTSGNIAGSNFGFNLPSTAIIDGIQVEAKYGGTRLGGGTNIQVGKGAKIGVKNVFDGNSSQQWYSTGGPTDLWGRTDWLVTDFDSSFFAQYSFTATSSPADAVCNLDAIRVTIYWHTAPADVETREVYKVYDASGNFIGILPQPNEKLKITQDINSLGSQITINVPISADTASGPTDPYITEDASATYTAEDGTSPYVTSGVIPIVSAAYQGINTLIKNGNVVQVWHYNYWYPNGKCMFVGVMRRWEADFGNDSDTVSVACYSTGYELDNYLTRGAPFSYTNDQIQTTNNNYVTVANYFSGGKGGGWNLYGQTFVVGAGVTNVGAITLLLTGSATVIVRLYNGINGPLLGEASVDVNGAINPTSIQFAFPALATASAGQQLFFTVDVAGGQTINLYYQNTDVYASGAMYNSSYGGGSGGGGWGIMAGDLYFITASGTNSTTATYTAKDPSTGMLAPIITDYNLRGGRIKWVTGSIDATGLTLTYTFKVNTLYEALQAILNLAPAGFYYYIDLGTETIYFKNQSTTADYVLEKGVDINAFRLVTTTENMKNTIMFSGGEVSPGVNLYKQYASAASIAAFGPLIDRRSDNRVTLDATADAIGNSAVAELSAEQNQTTITIAHTKRLDITLLVPGKTVAFKGYGGFIDGIIAQIVHREWSAEAVTLTLGLLPTRSNFEAERTKRGLIAEQTQDNPSTPS